MATGQIVNTKLLTRVFQFVKPYKIVFYKNDIIDFEFEYLLNEEYNWKRLEGEITHQVKNFNRKLK